MKDGKRRHKRRLAYGIVIGFVLFTALGILGHAGSLLNYGFPAMAMVIAGALMLLYPPVYAAFTLWLQFFAPLVRRLVDFQSSYHQLSPIIISPLLAGMFAFIPIARNPRFLLRREMLPFLVILGVITYAFVVGVLTNGAAPAAFDFAGWLLPIAFGIFLMMQGELYEEIRDTLVFASILGLLLISLYGLYQFYDFPPWDAYWLSESHFVSAGNGGSENVRVFSTLNSPAPYGLVLLACLTFVFVARGGLRLAAGGVGFAAFGLALARSAWGGWLVAVVYVVLRARGKIRMRIIVVGISVAIFAVPLLMVGPIAKQVGGRLDSFAHLSQDQSLQARQGLYKAAALQSISQPLGTGFGTIGGASKLSSGSAVDFDSGILEVPLQFGWAATPLFVWAIVALLLRAFAATTGSKDQIAIAGAGIYLAMLLENAAALDFPSNDLLWISLVFALRGSAVSKRKVALARGAAPRLAPVPAE